MPVPRQAALLLIATQFLTRLRVPTLRAFDADWVAQSLRYFPLVGAAVGLVNVAAWWLASRVLPMPVSVGVMLGVSLLLTGAFHEDGLADACDGFGGGRTREQVLEIMQDSRIGAFGALGLIVVLGLKWTALSALPAPWMPLALVIGHSVSRWCALGLIWALPYARTSGNSKSRPFASGLSLSGWILSALIAVPVPLAVALLWPQAHEYRIVAAVAGIAVLAAVLVCAVLGTVFRRRIAGYTGDCLGATQQLTELTMYLVTLASAAPRSGT